MTRAKKRFFFTSFYIKENKKWPNKPSRFINEVFGKSPSIEKEKEETMKNEFNKEKIIKEEIKNTNLLCLGEKQKLNHLNYLQFSTFLQCPLYYCYKYALTIPINKEEKNFNQIIIDILFYYLKEKSKGIFISLDQLENKLKNLWNNKEEESNQEEENEENTINTEKEQLTILKDIIKEFYFRDQKENVKTILVNQPFSFKIDNIEIDGTWDRIDIIKNHLNEEQIIVRQFKNAIQKGKKISKKINKTRDNNELLFHGWAYKKVFHKQPYKIIMETVDYNHLKMGTIIEYIQPTTEEFDSFEKKIKETITKIENGYFQATPSFYSCLRLCPYKFTCPSVYKNKNRTKYE